MCRYDTNFQQQQQQLQRCAFLYLMLVERTDMGCEMTLCTVMVIEVHGVAHQSVRVDQMYSPSVLGTINTWNSTTAGTPI